MSQHLSLPKDKIRFLLLEGVHQNAIDTLNAAGYTNIDYHKTALEGEALKEAIKDAHFIGIRSRTQLTEEIFEAANKLIAVGCFCIGTNQVDLKAAMSRGSPLYRQQCFPVPNPHHDGALQNASLPYHQTDKGCRRRDQERRAQYSYLQVGLANQGQGRQETVRKRLS
jgi:hypothetical protein